MKYIKLIIIAVIIISTDQITKQIIKNSISLFETIPIIDGFFNLTYLKNPGGAFSFFANQSPLLRNVMFKMLPIIAIFLLFTFYKTVSAGYKLLTYGLALVISGAASNLIDRFIFGFVIDFLDFYVKNIHWPAFNVADSAICVGIALILIDALFGKNIRNL